MLGLVRFGVSMDAPLAKRFDRLVRQRRYHNRSEAIRDMVRRELVRQHRQRLLLGFALMMVNRAAGFVLPAAPKFVIDDGQRAAFSRQRNDLFRKIISAARVQPCRSHNVESGQ